MGTGLGSRRVANTGSTDGLRHAGRIVQVQNCSGFHCIFRSRRCRGIDAEACGRAHLEAVVGAQGVVELSGATSGEIDFALSSCINGKIRAACAFTELPQTANATALESAAAKRRGFLMGLQPVESVLALHADTRTIDAA